MSAAGFAGISGSIHSTRRHISRRSRLTAIAGINRIVAPNAYMPIPGSTVASCAILTNTTGAPTLTVDVSQPPVHQQQQPHRTAWRARRQQSNFFFFFVA